MMFIANWPDGTGYGKMNITSTCLLYTSDAADERSSVDLGGRRIIKKKKKEEIDDTLIITKKDIY